MDSNDRERLQEARDELHGILDSDEMRGVPVVVIANKQDLPRKLVIHVWHWLSCYDPLVYLLSTTFE